MGIRKEDYVFTVEVEGESWDCYHFHKDDKPGTLGFTMRDGRFVIGMFCGGHLSEEESRAQLEKSHKRETN